MEELKMELEYLKAEIEKEIEDCDFKKGAMSVLDAVIKKVEEKLK